MVGVRVGCDQEIDAGNAEFFKIADNPVSLVNLTGIDQDDLVLKEDDRGVPLPDIEEICPQVARGVGTQG